MKTNERGEAEYRVIELARQNPIFVATVEVLDNESYAASVQISARGTSREQAVSQLERGFVALGMMPKLVEARESWRG